MSDVESIGGELSLKAMNRIQEVVSLSTAVRQLKRYAWNSISILSTKNTASVSYSLLPLSLPTEDDGLSARFLDLLGENVVIERDMEKLNRNVRMFNQVLPTVLHLLVDLIVFVSCESEARADELRHASLVQGHGRAAEFEGIEVLPARIVCFS